MKRIWAKVLAALRIRKSVDETFSYHDLLANLKELIRGSTSIVEASQASLADMMAKHILARKSINHSLLKIEELTVVAHDALVAGEESAALQIAEMLGRLQNSVLTETDRVNTYTDYIEDIQTRLEHHESLIAGLKQWVVKITEAAEAVQTAEAAAPSITGDLPIPALLLARDHLSALRQRALESTAYFQAQQEVFNESDDFLLEQRLRDAQVIQGTADPQLILARIKAQIGDPHDEPAQFKAKHR